MMLQRDNVRVYLAGPISRAPHVEAMRGMLIGNFLIACGLVPFVPQQSVFANDYLPDSMSQPVRYEFWMSYDKKVLSQQDVLLRLPGNSGGADREEVWAEEFNIPTFHTIRALFNYVHLNFEDVLEYGTFPYSPKKVEAILELSILSDINDIKRKLIEYESL